MNLSVLADYGIDKDRGLAACMNDESFYAVMLSMFLQQTVLESAEAAYVKHDRPALYEAAHEIKGISGSTGMTELYSAASGIVEQLRCADTDIDGTGIYRMFRELEAAYNKAREGITHALA